MTHRHEISYTYRRTMRPVALAISTMVGVLAVLACGANAGDVTPPSGTAQQTWLTHMAAFFPPDRVLSLVALLLCSAFFSGSETALFSIHKLRVRALREEESLTARLIVHLLDEPGRLLTTILVANVLVNVLIGALIGANVEGFLDAITHWPEPLTYAVATVTVTSGLLFFGEILPKVIAVRAAESFSRAVSVPLRGIERALAPLCSLLLRFTDLLFRAVHFHEFRAAPFITDEELRSVLSDSEAHGVIEEEERQMIEGILEFSDALVRELLVPRPSVVAIEEDATISQALDVLREHDYSRLPVYRESLDQIVGILVAKDLLPASSDERKNRPVRPLLRPAHFVPETMTVRQFVRDAQRRRTHMAVVVDEYGGTAGIVTLHDAIQEVVGDILDEGEQELVEYEQLDANAYRVTGSFSLDELSELMGIEFEDSEHSTVAGLLMDQAEKLPEVGDEVICLGMRFTVEACEGRRASSVRIEVLPKTEYETAPEDETP